MPNHTDSKESCFCQSLGGSLRQKLRPNQDSLDLWVLLPPNALTTLHSGYVGQGFVLKNKPYRRKNGKNHKSDKLYYIRAYLGPSGP